MVQRLPDTSLTAALMAGGRHKFGWGVDRLIAADTFDALNVNTQVSGTWRNNKPPKFPRWPRPDDKAKSTEKKKVSVADLYRNFTGR